MILSDDEEGQSDSSRSLDTSEELDFEDNVPRQRIDSLTRDELEEAFEADKLLFEEEKKKMKEEIENLQKQLADQKAKSGSTFGFFSMQKTTKTVTQAPTNNPPHNQESTAIIDDLLGQIKELSLQRAASMDTIDELREDLEESKKRLRGSVMENVALRTQIASLEERVKTLETDPNRANNDRKDNKEDLFGNNKMITELSEKLEESKIKVMQLTNDKEKLEKKVKQLSEDLLAQTTMVSLRYQELGILSEENNTFQKDIKDKGSQIKELKKQLECESEQLESFKRTSFNLENQLKEVQNQNKNVTN
eukprot:TRINITY_DN4381_c0_g1_i1.p1 TRINITY_DN4381_c0_g1~~TRINITY_DN4381_c0_g1_i1.p1  ORF type:complete len:307 (+),score=104.59 TRINITY_DN4381_c0_g1_i1:139-1059(+)